VDPGAALVHVAVLLAWCTAALVVAQHAYRRRLT
jgi:hypothetical protein